MKSFIRAVAMLLLGCAAVAIRAHGPSDDMARAANAFLAALPEEKRAKATFEFKEDERLNWHFVPRERKGLPLKEMTGDQRALAHALLSSGLSHKGYFKANAIISLEQVLKEIEQGRGPARDPEMYFVSIFGTPDAHGQWAWRFEGHHLALNFTIAGHDVAFAPSFLGSNPGEIRQGPRKGFRALAAEEDLGRALVKSLNEEQLKKTIFDERAPSDIITGADRKARVLEPKGIAMADLNAEQKKMLLEVIHEYIFRARPELAESQFEEIKNANPSELHFAWAGATEPGKGHYYRVQGPGFLLEYDNTQNGANHVHAVWRDLNNDFGEDLLRKHYDESHSK